MFRLVSSRLRRFFDDTKGSVSVETVIIVPILFWAMIALFIFFDAYRAKSTNVKAAFTISDILSRETNEIDTTYLNSMHLLFDEMLSKGTSTGIRVSSISWNSRKNAYNLDWSQSQGSLEAHRQTDVDLLAQYKRFPLMSPGEAIILVETKSQYDPSMNVGLGTQDISTFIFTRPRFSPQLVWTRNYND